MPRTIEVTILLTGNPHPNLLPLLLSVFTSLILSAEVGLLFVGDVVEVCSCSRNDDVEPTVLKKLTAHVNPCHFICQVIFPPV
jgi:hypothetical protein